MHWKSVFRVDEFFTQVPRIILFDRIVAVEYFISIVVVIGETD